MWADEALQLTIDSLAPGSRVLDVGSGKGHQADRLEAAGHIVERVDLEHGAPYLGTPTRPGHYDCVWCSHVLEHMPDLQANINKMRLELKPGGLLAVTVPPLKHEIVGGHVNLFNAGLLLYRLILSGFDCSKAAVKEYGYNISVLVRRVDIKPFPALRMDSGDVEILACYFPFKVSEGFDGRIACHSWDPL